MTKLLPLAVAALGLFVLVVGWLFDVERVRTVLDGEVSQKPATCIGLIIIGLCVFVVKVLRVSQYGTAIAMTATTVAVGFITVGDTVIHTIKQSDMVTLGLAEAPSDAVMSIAPGVPSLFTPIAFLVILIACYEAGRRNRESRLVSQICGLAAIVLGLVPLIGYVIDSDAMKYHLPPYSGAMAIHTAASVVALGLALVWRSAIYLDNLVNEQKARHLSQRDDPASTGLFDLAQRCRRKRSNP